MEIRSLSNAPEVILRAFPGSWYLLRPDESRLFACIDKLELASASEKFARLRNVYWPLAIRMTGKKRMYEMKVKECSLLTVPASTTDNSRAVGRNSYVDSTDRLIMKTVHVLRRSR